MWSGYCVTTCSTNLKFNVLINNNIIRNDGAYKTMAKIKLSSDCHSICL